MKEPIWKPRGPIDSTVKGPFPDLIGRVLSSRGINTDELDRLLNPKLSQLKDPFTLKGMTEACDRLIKAFRQNEKICIYADFDLDGTSGLAILKTGFEKIGFKDVAHYQPRRLSEGYGFHAEAVEELAHLGISTIVTVDVGITSYAAFEKAKELGVDVILTDHHLPGEKLPDAFTIVNPNQGNCPSGLGYLCGAGVAFYLLRALKRKFFESDDLPKNEWDLKDVLEYFCIGTLTDMVPLVEDNRVLVKHGMYVLGQTTKPGLRALLKALDLDGRDLTSQDVAIKYAPKLNALSRMESDVLPAQIFLETDSKKAEHMVSKVLTNNQTRQSLQQEAESLALDLLKKWTVDDFVFVSSQFFHRGIIGLIATKLSQTFNRPAFVGSENSEGMIVGSCRTPQGSEISLVAALQHAHQALNRHGGHSAAAGFEMHSDKQGLFIDLMKDFFENAKKGALTVEIDFDTEARLSEIDSSMMKWHDHLGPFGVGFQVPLLKFNDVMLASLKELKGGHLKLKLSGESLDSSMEALLFSPTERLKKSLQVGLKYSILGELQWNYFNGRKSIQMLVKDLKVL